MRKVVGIGWAKTGTTTLGECFETLGLRHAAGRLDLVDHLETGDLSPILAEARHFDAFEDWPWLLVFRELDEAFPGSKFVLTTRNAEAWLRSYRNMLDTQGAARPRLVRQRRILYDLPFPDVTEEQLLDRVRRHEREVQAWFADRPDDLLVVDWARGNGWQELCDFLDLPIPDVPFPHANRGHYAPRA